MGDLRSVITSAFLALAACVATVNPSQADTGTVRIVFGAAGVVAGVGNGQGTLTLHGKTYPFEVSGASFGATLGNPLFDRLAIPSSRARPPMQLSHTVPGRHAQPNQVT